MDEKSIVVGQDRPNLVLGFDNGSYPAGYVFYRYQQTLKLQIPDYNGDPVIHALSPTFTFKQTSTNGSDSPTTMTVQ